MRKQAARASRLPAPPAKFAESFAPPPPTEAAAELEQAIAAWRKAADGDSGDEENNAGNELAHIAESYLRSTAAAPPLALDASELATALAALRLFQREYEDCSGDAIRADWPDYFPNEGGSQEVSPLGTDDIDDLCERLNFAAAASGTPHLLAVCQSTLTALENMTTDAFSKGGNKALRGGLRAAIAAHRAKPEIVIEVKGGIADVREYPTYADIRIVDWDAFDSGDHTLTGENAVIEELRAWIEANEPEWYVEQMEREADLDAQRAASKSAAARPRVKSNLL